MQPPIERMVLLPRYTALSGAVVFKSAPIWLRPYATMKVAAWRSIAVGTSVDLSIVFRQSHDLETWSDITTLSPSAGQESTASLDLRADWFMFEAQVSGSDPALTCWAVADLVPRHT